MRVKLGEKSGVLKANGTAILCFSLTYHHQRKQCYLESSERSVEYEIDGG